MGLQPIPRRKLKALEQTVPISALKTVISPASSVVDADTTLFGTALAVDIATKFNLLLEELRASGIFGRKTGGIEV